MLKTAAILNFILAAGHIICMPWLNELFRIYGIDGIMNQIASHGVYLPYLITVIIALCFALCALYALSAARIIPRLPLLWTGIVTITAIFLFRAGIGCVWMFSNYSFPFIKLSSVIISGSIGTLYLMGAICAYKHKK